MAEVLLHGTRKASEILKIPTTIPYPTPTDFGGIAAGFTKQAEIAAGAKDLELAIALRRVANAANVRAAEQQSA